MNLHITCLSIRKTANGQMQAAGEVFRNAYKDIILSICIDIGL